MGNPIELFKVYIDQLDEVYKQASKTSVLDSDGGIFGAGANAGEVVIPKMTMNGLADYSRSGGYVSGDVTLGKETKSCDYDRGRKFTVDAMDNEESAGVAFGKLSSEFIRTQVVPELDAVRMAKYAKLAGIKYSDSISDGTGVLNAISKILSDMDEKEVSEEGRILFITPTLHNLILSLDTTKSKEILNGFSSIVKMPSSRFKSSIALYDGKTSGEEAGGFVPTPSSYVLTEDTKFLSWKTYYTESSGTYTKAAVTAGADVAANTYYEDAGARDINFMIVQKNAVLQFMKHNVNKVISPEENQESDGWMFFFRAYGLNDAFENKLSGIGVSFKE